jgi:cytochrome c5
MRRSARYTSRPRFALIPGAIVSASHDRKFFDTFMLVLGILLGVTIGLIILARLIAGPNLLQHKSEDPVFQQELLGRIAPVARVAVAGEDNSALAAPAPAAEAVAAAEDLPGETVYNQACVACHGAGIAGAPKMGDVAAWAPRIAQGADTLHTHALQGYQGKAGYMPPKGGRTDLSDQSVINAVDYIVAASQ